MALPKYDELYGNVMCALKEGGEKSRRELREAVAKQIGLSAAEQEEQLPSGASVWSSFPAVHRFGAAGSVGL